MGDETQVATRASRALKTWMAETSTSQVKLAELLTKALGAFARVPVNQSTVSAWARGAYLPSGQAMVAIQQVTGIPVTEWIVAAEASAPSLPAVDDTETDAA